MSWSLPDRLLNFLWLIKEFRLGSGVSFATFWHVSGEAEEEQEDDDDDEEDGESNEDSLQA